MTEPRQPQYITLNEWARRKFVNPPHRNTLHRWATDGRIQPRPFKAGSATWVSPDATFLEVGPPLPAGWKAPQRTFLYRHFNEAGDLLYVGISLCVVSRLSQHVDGSPWAAEIANITITHFPTRPEALAAEAAAILTENPKYNVVGRKPKPAPKPRRPSRLGQRIKSPRELEREAARTC